MIRQLLALVTALLLLATAAPALQAESSREGTHSPRERAGHLTGWLDGQYLWAHTHTRSFGTHEITTFRGSAGTEYLHGRTVRFPTAREGTQSYTTHGWLGQRPFHLRGTERTTAPGRTRATGHGPDGSRTETRRERRTDPTLESLTTTTRIDGMGITFNGVINHLDSRPGMTGYADPRVRLGTLRPSAAREHLGARQFEGRDNAASHISGRQTPATERPAASTPRPRIETTAQPQRRQAVRTPQSTSVPDRSRIEVRRDNIQPSRGTSSTGAGSSRVNTGTQRSGGASAGSSSPFPSR